MDARYVAAVFVFALGSGCMGGTGPAFDVKAGTGGKADSLFTTQYRFAPTQMVSIGAGATTRNDSMHMELDDSGTMIVSVPAYIVEPDRLARIWIETPSEP